MSTKVYTGFRFIPQGLAAVAAAVKDITPAIETMQRNRYVKAFACLLVNVLDQTQAAQRAGTSTALQEDIPVWWVDGEIRRRQARVRASRRRDPAVDLEVLLRCWHSPSLDRIIGFVASEFSSPVRKLLIERGIVEDFAYWDCSDPDEEVLEAEWEVRKCEWDAALDGNFGAAFSFTFDESMACFTPTWKELEPAIPSLETRAQNLARPSLFQKVCVENNWSGPGTDLYEKYCEISDQLCHDEELKARLRKEVDEFTAILLTGVALEDTAQRKQLLKVPNQASD